MRLSLLLKATIGNFSFSESALWSATNYSTSFVHSSRLLVNIPSGIFPSFANFTFYKPSLLSWAFFSILDILPMVSTLALILLNLAISYSVLSLFKCVIISLKSTLLALLAYLTAFLSTIEFFLTK